MTEHSQTPTHDDAHEDTDLGGATGIVSRIASSAAKDMGYPKVAEAIERWPELVGKAIATPFRKIGAAAKSGAPRSVELEQEAQNAILSNPSQAAPLLGILLASSLQDGVDAPSEKQAILSSYMQVLNVIGQVALELKTSLALRGFLHRSDCISYWHFTGRGSKEKIFYLQGDHISLGVSFELYLLEREPSDDAINQLNQQIRSNNGRQLPSQLFDFRKNEKVARVEEVHELKVTMQMLDPDRERKAADSAKNPFRVIN